MEQVESSLSQQVRLGVVTVYDLITPFPGEHRLGRAFFHRSRDSSLYRLPGVGLQFENHVNSLRNDGSEILKKVTFNYTGSCCKCSSLLASIGTGT